MAPVIVFDAGVSREGPDSVDPADYFTTISCRRGRVVIGHSLGGHAHIGRVDGVDGPHVDLYARVEIPGFISESLMIDPPRESVSTGHGAMVVKSRVDVDDLRGSFELRSLTSTASRRECRGRRTGRHQS